MKFKKLAKYSFSTTKMPKFIPTTHLKSGPDTKFLKRFAVWVNPKK